MRTRQQTPFYSIITGYKKLLYIIHKKWKYSDQWHFQL